MKTLDRWRSPRDCIAARDTDKCSENDDIALTIRAMTRRQQHSYPPPRLCMHLVVVAASFSLCYRAQSQQSPLPSARGKKRDDGTADMTPVCDGLAA